MCMYKCKICKESYYRDEVRILDNNMSPIIEEDQVNSNDCNKIIICHSCEDNNIL